VVVTVMTVEASARGRLAEPPPGPGVRASAGTRLCGPTRQTTTIKASRLLDFVAIAFESA
jgi:hypothetical protein